MSTPDPLRTMIADIVRSEFALLQRPAGPHTYRVAAVRSDGRVDLKPEDKKRGLDDIPNVDHWTGVAGGAALPMVGSVAMVEFADGDSTKPMLVSYQPLRSAGGKPTRTTIDATTLQLGPTATVVQLGGGADFVALATLVLARLSALVTSIGSTVIVPSDGGASFKSTLLAALTANGFTNSVAASKVKAT